MDKYILKLVPEGRESQDLQLQSHKLERSILDIAKSTSSHVFCDLRYSGELNCSSPKDISNLCVYINGVLIESTYSPSSGIITFNDYLFGSRIFTECYGFVQISLTFENNNNHIELESEYIQVMVRKGIQNDSVRRMAEYVYKHNSLLLYGNRIFPKDAAGLQENAFRTLEAKILLLKQIALVFKDTYKYFQTNSKFSTLPKEFIDNFEKLQYVSQRSIQYMAQHPEELHHVPGNTGIKSGFKYYQPNKTLITKNVPSFDIYENQYVVSFLKNIINEISSFEHEINDALSHLPTVPKETDNYVASSYFVYVNTTETLRVTLADIKKLHKDFNNLFFTYSKILPVKSIFVNGPPKSTHIFMSIPHYRHIYDSAVSWYKMGAFTLDEQHYMLSFLKASALYEVYILSKFTTYLLDCQYNIQNIEKKTYPFSGKTLYENTYCNNYFVFKKGESVVTLYYQPVIYNSDKRAVANIGLYRNTSISFPKSLDDDIITGKYYTPDFIVKFESTNGNGAKYIIADAKFSTLDNVKKRQVAALAYKYLFSISSFDPNDSIAELCIINGQSNNQDDSITNIYDFAFQSNAIMPFAEILTLTENNENNTSLHFSILDNLFGKHLI